MKPNRISLVVGGKFSSDILAKALHSMGFDVSIHTTLPRSRFSKDFKVSSHLFPEMIFRAGKKLGLEDAADLMKMRLFGRQMVLNKETKLNHIIAWSSFALESFQNQPALTKGLVRESTHIRFQQSLLEDEYARLGLSFGKRHQVLLREIEEYRLADWILVPSNFAKESFLKAGVAEEKLFTLPLGIDTGFFSFSPIHRKKGPLRIIYVGAVSVRKGIHYLLEGTKHFGKKSIDLTLVGPVERGYEKILNQYSHFRYLGPKSKSEIKNLLRSYDVFAFPSLEDGYGNSVLEGAARGVVPIVSTNAGSHEWFRNDVDALLIPPFSSEAIADSVDRLVKDKHMLYELKNNLLKLRKEFGLNSYAKRVKTLMEDRIGIGHN